MKEEIINNLDNPLYLEERYRDNEKTFKQEFNTIYPDIKENIAAQIWNERLNFKKETIPHKKNYDLLFVIIASIVAVIIAKFPEFIYTEEEYLYPRNIAFVCFPFLITYFSWKQEINKKKIIILSSVVLFSFVYIFLLPQTDSSNTLILTCIHLPIFLWFVLAYCFVGGDLKDYTKRIDFLRYNVDLLVVVAIVLIVEVIIYRVISGLFFLLYIDIYPLYYEYIVLFGYASSPILGTYLVQTYPQMVNKISPIITKVCTPLILITLVFFLINIFSMGRSPYDDMHFLMMLNLLLFGVMAVILFSIGEISKSSNCKITYLLLLALATIIIFIGGIALSAILYRLVVWGVSPNRLAILGINTLVLINLLILTYKLFKVNVGIGKMDDVEKSIAKFLPIYCVWTVIVSFVFPIIFKFQ